jgi:hypothetical protein
MHTKLVVRRIGIFSLARNLGILYALLKFLLGCVFALFVYLRGGVVRPSFQATLFGVYLPIVYGVGAFIVGLIAGALYNWLAGILGGVEIEITS